MKLFMIRHGQTTTNRDRIYTGQSNAALTEQGRQEAMAIRPILANIHFDKVYSSDLQRAMDTQLLALPDVQAVTTPLLREFDVGSAEGQPFGNIFAPYGDSYRQAKDYSVFGGENAEMVCGRLGDFLVQLEAAPVDHVAVFTHNGVINCMLQMVLGVMPRAGSVLSKNCGIHVFSYDERGWQLAAWNYMGGV